MELKLSLKKKEEKRVLIKNNNNNWSVNKNKQRKVSSKVFSMDMWPAGVNGLPQVDSPDMLTFIIQ